MAGLEAIGGPGGGLKVCSTVLSLDGAVDAYESTDGLDWRRFGEAFAEGFRRLGLGKVRMPAQHSPSLLARGKIAECCCQATSGQMQKRSNLGTYI